MAANTYTTADLISLTKLLSHVPQANSTFTEANLLTLADFELQTSIAPMMKEADEGYFQEIVEYAQNSTGEYAVPTNAIASTSYSVQVRNGQAIWPVSRQAVAEMTTTTYPSVSNYSFFIRGNTFNLLPAQFDGVLRITYERRPSKLVTVSKAAQVSAINSQIVTVTSVPSAWAVGDAIDLQSSQPQFDVLGLCEITNISGTDITLSGDLGTLAAGDYLCLSSQSCIPQIPVEFHQYLAQRVVCKIYELQGYLDKLAKAEQIRDAMAMSLTALITPRTQSAMKIVNPSWGGRKPGGSWARFNPPAGNNG